MTLREEINELYAEAITLLEQGNDSTDLYNRIDRLEQTLLEGGRFSIASILYRSFISLIKSQGVRDDVSFIQGIKKDLTGESHYQHTYLIQHNLSSLIQNNQPLYQEIMSVMLAMSQGDSALSNDQKFHIEQLCISASVITLADFILVHVGNIISRLPNPKQAIYNPSEIGLPYRLRYSSIYPPQDLLIDIEEQVSYINAMLKKLHGESYLFVDVHFTPYNETLLIR